MNNKEQAKLNKIAAEERKKAIADNELLSSLADSLTKKLQGQADRLGTINKLRSNLVKNLVDEVDNLEVQKKLIYDYTEEINTQIKLLDKRKGGNKDLVKYLEAQVKELNQIVEREEKRVKIQDSLQKKADAIFDGIESQVRKIPLVGDLLADTLDFGGMKKEFGGILKGVTQNFMSLKAGGMSTGAAISQSFGAALPLLKQFGKMLLASLGPIMLVVGALYLIKKAFDFNKETTQLAKDLGVSVDEARGMEKSFNNMSVSSSNLNVNTKSLVEAQKQLSSATGLTAEFSEQMLTDQIQLTKFMGLSGDEAANFQKIATDNNQTARELQGEIAGSVEQFNNATGASIALKDVVQDIAKLPADIRAGFKGTTAELAKTISLAKAMGTTLEKSVAAGKATLDIETSLKNEAQARILTGVSINNNAIRAAQLAGNQAEVLRLQKEEMQKIGDIGDYLPYQQEALAAAMGMSTAELVEQSEQMKLLEKVGGDLSKATLDEIKNNSDLTDEQKDQLIQQKEQVSAQERLSQIGAKFKDMLNSIVSGPLGQIAELLVTIIVPAFKGLNFLLTPFFDTLTGISAILSGTTDKLDTWQKVMGVIGITLGVVYGIYKGIATYNAIITAAKETQLILENGNKAGILQTIGAMTVKLGVQLGILSASLATNAAVTFGVGVAIAVAAAAAGYAAIKAMSTADDMVAPAGYGDRVLKGPEGSIALNNKDSVIAGTNLFGNEGSGNTDSGTNQMGAIFQQLVSEVRGLRSDIQAQPIMITVDGKVVSQITRVQNKQSSFRK